MFTGIVQQLGSVHAVTPRKGDIELIVTTAPGYLHGVALGDSISVNGCCLTVTRLQGDAFAADVSRETLQMTSLGACTAGTAVNLEKALRAGDALGGHYVTGHIDGLAEVAERHGDARSERMTFRAPKHLGKYIAKKGSVTVDGVSLTVNEVSDAGDATNFSVNLIPHTLAVTILRDYRVGQRVNIEVDIIARYVARMQSAGQ